MHEAASDGIKAFARIAEEYCDWAEAAPGDAVPEARRARRLLIELLRRAIDLPDVSSSEASNSVGDDEYHRVYGRFGVLPFNYYSACFDPLVVPGENPVVADLADDLTDIWRDLKGGLLLWREEARNEAAWQWRFSFETHWGHHATAAIYALQTWFAQNVGDSES